MDVMAFASLSKSLLSRMSISGYPNGTATPTTAISMPMPAVAMPTSGSSEGVTANGDATSPIQVAVGRRRASSGTSEGDLSGLLIGSFSPIRNMELYPPRVKVIEEGCTYQEVPFALLSGENVEYMGRLHEAELLYLTNYRLLATHGDGIFSVPIGIIECVEVLANKETLTFLCRDARIFRLAFANPLKARAFHSHMLSVLRASYTDHRNIFAFVRHAYQKDMKLDRGASRNSLTRHHLANLATIGPDDSREELVTSEFLRMGMGRVDRQNNDACRWRISQCNSKYEVCATYPKLFIVPNSIAEQELVQASKFRMLGRLPVVVWRHPENGSVIVRSSQPLVGMLSWRSCDDEKLLSAVSRACSTHGNASGGGIPGGSADLSKSCETTTSSQSNHREPLAVLDRLSGAVGLKADRHCGPQLVVMDLRSYAVTLGNRAKGGGSECADYYSNCDIRFKGLPNIHSVRKSFQQLRAVLAADDQVSFLSNLESTQWLSYICELLAVACEVVGVVQDSARPILIHCSDGWDRTTQVVALAELMLDPYYRTMQGFRVMLEREWLSYGHKFGDRCGHTCDDTNQRCPVFLQWLDSVHQLMRQHPCDFEFNEHFLVKLGHHAYSCFFGTFLGNNMKEREAWRLAEDSTPIWTFLHRGNPDIVNFLYKPPRVEHKVLRPIAHIHRIFLWKAMYCTPILCPYNRTSLSSLTDITDAKDKCSPKIRHNAPKDCVVHNGSPSSCGRNDTAKGTNIGDAFCAKKDAHEGRASFDNDDDISLDLDSDGNHLITDQSNGIDAADITGNGPCCTTSEEVTESLKSMDARDDELVESLKNHEFHESLHLKMSMSKDITTVNGSTPIDILPLSPASPSTTWSDADEPRENGDEHSLITQTHLPSSTIEMRPILKQPSGYGDGGEGGRVAGLSPEDERKAHSPPCANGRLPTLQRDVSHAATFSHHHLDADGLPCNGDLVHARLKEMAYLHSAQIRELTMQLEKAKERVTVTNSMSQVVDIHDALEESQSEKESPSSLTGWECVEGRGEGMRWIPDHAVNYCCGCGERFWTAKRKHHCRSCGKVFCRSCSDYFCPVPEEQLFDDVRVCEKCFYKLDGHLKQKTSQNLGPTFT